MCFVGSRRSLPNARLVHPARSLRQGPGGSPGVAAAAAARAEEGEAPSGTAPAREPHRRRATACVGEAPLDPPPPDSTRDASATPPEHRAAGAPHSKPPIRPSRGIAQTGGRRLLGPLRSLKTLWALRRTRGKGCRIISVRSLTKVTNVHDVDNMYVYGIPYRVDA